MSKTGWVSFIDYNDGSDRDIMDDTIYTTRQKCEDAIKSNKDHDKAYNHIQYSYSPPFSVVIE